MPLKTKQQREMPWSRAVYESGAGVGQTQELKFLCYAIQRKKNKKNLKQVLFRYKWEGGNHTEAEQCFARGMDLGERNYLKGERRKEHRRNLKGFVVHFSARGHVKAPSLSLLSYSVHLPCSNPHEATPRFWSPLSAY